MAVHAAPHSGGAVHKTHHPSARFYLLIFLILAVVTLAEVFVAQEPFLTIFGDMGLPGRALFPLLILAAAKFFMIAAFYMHLKQDSRLFTAFFVVGLILALGMWGTFMGLFTAHYRQPFDQIAWREQIAQQSGAGTGATTGAAAGGH
jgi:cytochrome c oxidase subunit 4